MYDVLCVHGHRKEVPGICCCAAYLYTVGVFVCRTLFIYGKPNGIAEFLVFFGRVFFACSTRFLVLHSCCSVGNFVQPNYTDAHTHTQLQYIVIISITINISILFTFIP